MNDDRKQLQALGALDMVGTTEAPPHYSPDKGGGLEVIDRIRYVLTPEQYTGFLLGNTLKYRSRAGEKGSAAEDEDKACWYEQMMRHLTDPKTFVDPRATRPGWVPLPEAFFTDREHK